MTSNFQLSTALSYYSSKQPERVALRVGQTVLRWMELHELVNQLSSQLFSAGLGPGERLGLISENSFEAVLLMLAAIQSGICIVPLNLYAGEDEWLRQLKEAEVSRVVLSSALKNDHLIKNFQIIQLESLQVSRDSSPESSVQSKQLVSEEAAILFTSGSSGGAKGVILSSDNLLYAAIGSNQVTGFSAANCWLLSLPLYHAGGLCILTRALVAGASIEIPGLVTVKNLAQRILDSHSDFISLVPTQLAELLKDRACLQRLKQFRTILLGGAASSSDLIGQIKEFRLPVLSSYGMTETAAHVSCTAHSDSEDKLASVGRALPGVNFEISSEGILIIRGPQVCKAYLNGKQLDGALVTNDLAQIDGAGYLYILGRSDRMIISGGENIPAARIELCAEQVSGVKSAAVVAQSDPKWGQTPVLFLEVAGEVSTEELLVKIREHFKLNLPRYMYPAHIEVLQELPRTGIGKINYQALQDILL